MRILVTGAGGQVGRAIQGAALHGAVEVLPFTRQDLDVTELEAVDAALSAARPDFAVNAAAFTAVDEAENEPDAARAVNEGGAANLGQVCAARGVPLLHLSTDYVFDGRAPGPYRESDAPNPINVYGATKLAGEREVRRLTPRHLIVRTSWVYGVHGRNFVKTILQRAREERELHVVADQRGSPTSATELARHLLRMMERATATGFAGWGTYHCTDAGQTTWYGLATTTVDIGRSLVALRVERIRPIASADRPTPAARPANSVLSCEEFDAAFGTPREPWQKPLERVVRALVGP